MCSALLLRSEEEFAEVFPARKGDDARCPLCHTPAVCPMAVGHSWAWCSFPLQARGESLNAFSKKQQLNLIRVCHFSAKKASFLPPERMNRFLLVWPRFKPSVEALPGFDLASGCELNVPAGTIRSPGLILIPVLRASLLGCFRAHPERVGFMGKLSVWQGFLYSAGGRAVFDQTASQVLTTDFHFTFQWTEERSGFSCESQKLNSWLLQARRYILCHFYGSDVWAWRNKENSSWFPHPGCLVKRYQIYFSFIIKIDSK